MLYQNNTSFNVEETFTMELALESILIISMLATSNTKKHKYI